MKIKLRDLLKNVSVPEKKECSQWRSHIHNEKYSNHCDGCDTALSWNDCIEAFNETEVEIDVAALRALIDKETMLYSCPYDQSVVAKAIAESLANGEIIGSKHETKD